MDAKIIIKELERYSIEDLREICRYLKFDLNYRDIYISGSKEDLLNQFKQIPDEDLEKAIQAELPEVLDLPSADWSVKQIVDYLDDNYVIEDIRNLCRYLKYKKDVNLSIAGYKDELIKQLRNISKENLIDAINSELSDFWIKEAPKNFTKSNQKNEIAFHNKERAQYHDRIESVVLALRDLVHYGLLLRNGPNYWEEGNIIATDVKKNVEDKIQKEMKRHPQIPKSDYKFPRKKLQYCDIMEYWKIIEQSCNRPIFEKIFSFEITKAKFVNLDNFRVKIDHSHEDLIEIDKKEGEAAIEWFSQVLSIKWPKE